MTRKKSHIYNGQYLDRLWLWKHFLSDGGPRLTIKTGEQSILVDANYATTEVCWPGVPDDALDVKNEPVAETLFSIADFMDEDGDEDWWDDGEDDDGDDDDTEAPSPAAILGRAILGPSAADDDNDDDDVNRHSAKRRRCLR